MTKTARTEEDQRLIEEWLKKNKPTVCPPATRSGPDKINKYKMGWGKNKKKKDS